MKAVKRATEKADLAIHDLVQAALAVGFEAGYKEGRRELFRGRIEVIEGIPRQ